MHMHAHLVCCFWTEKEEQRLRQLPSHFPAEARSGVTHTASRLGGQMEFMASRHTDERTTFSSVTILPDVSGTKDAAGTFSGNADCDLFTV